MMKLNLMKMISIIKRIRGSKDEDEEMLKVEVEDFDKVDEEVTDAAKADAKKTLEDKDDAYKTKLPHQALAYLYSTVKEYYNARDQLILGKLRFSPKFPHIQSPFML
ncbi:hypothetical protein Tco_1548850 [Tanacetum coccineum]